MGSRSGKGCRAALWWVGQASTGQCGTGLERSSRGQSFGYERGSNGWSSCGESVRGGTVCAVTLCSVGMFCRGREGVGR